MLPLLLAAVPTAALFGTVEVSLLVLLALVAAVILLAVLYWSVKHRRGVNVTATPDAPISELVPSLSGLTHSAIYPGNTVELLENGAFFDVLLQEIEGAQQSVHFETFLWKDGTLGRRLAQTLADRARAGVAVRVLVDANGGKEMGDATIHLLETAGCRFAKYHEGRLRTLGRLNNRDHRKLAIVDGRVAFAGGHCIVDTWLGDAKDRDHVRDLSVRVEGPVVHGLQSVFSENWVAETGELFIGEAAFPRLDAVGDVPIHIASIQPSGSASSVEILHYLAVRSARKRLWIQNPYFLPDPDGIQALIDAVERGVDVRVMAPSTDASDMPLVQHAAHHNFDRLLEGGVRIFEYEHCLLHQKVMTVDGVWCAVGSANFDDRSMEINDEVTLGLHSPDLARQLEALFEHDRQRCVERTPEEWAQRPWWKRTRDAALYLINEQL